MVLTRFVNRYGYLVFTAFAAALFYMGSIALHQGQNSAVVCLALAGVAVYLVRVLK